MSDEKEKKKPLLYKFYCKICGTEMRVVKKHATTCSDTCRVALSNIMRYGAEPNEPLSKEQREEVDAKIKSARGQDGVDVIGKITGAKERSKKNLQKPISDKDVKAAKEAQATVVPPPANEAAPKAEP